MLIRGFVPGAAGAGLCRGTGSEETKAGLYDLLTKLYQGFVAWISLSEETCNQDELERRKEQVARRLSGFHDYYLPRRVWLDFETCKRIERFVEKCEQLYAEFSSEIDERGYRGKSGLAWRNA